MTLVANAPSASPEAPAPPGQGAPARRRVAAVWSLLVLAVVGLTIGLTEGPVAHVWYASRQHRLGGETGSVGQLPVGRQVGALLLPAITSGTSATPAEQVYVVQGDGTAQLRGGPGHQPETAVPGTRGNAVIFGHRYHWGGPFRELASMTQGAQIQAQSVDGTQPLVYTVSQVRTVPAGDAAVLAPTKDYRLTLITAGRGGRWLVVTAVSGAARPRPASAVRLSGPDGASSAADVAIAALAGCALLAGLIVVGLRRRVRSSTLWLLLAPIVAGGLLAFGLVFDLVFPTLA